jgi:hypothetical protein
MRAVIFGLALVAGTTGGSLAVLGAADPRPVTIAVLRGDGVLIPIVTRTGTKWSHTWPVPAKVADVPLTLDEIPKRWWGKAGPITRWHAWQIDGSTSDVIPEKPTWYLAHCQQGVGLTTSLTARPPIPPPTIQPYPKLGLAATAALPFRRIEAVDQSAPNWMAVVDAVTAAMTKGEEAMAGTAMMRIEGRAAPHPIEKAERDKVPVRVETLYRAPFGDGRFLYYLEATKRYGMPKLIADQQSKLPAPRKGCWTMTFGQGWFLSGPDGKVGAIPHLAARLVDCDYSGAQLMLPLAALGDDKPPEWIVQFTGWENESFAVMRWDAEQENAEVAFLTSGGFCPTGSSW